MSPLNGVVSPKVISAHIEKQTCQIDPYKYTDVSPDLTLASEENVITLTLILKAGNESLLNPKCKPEGIY